MKRTATFYQLTSFPSKTNGAAFENRRKPREVSPSESVIRNLLSYSRALTVIKTRETGFINLLMN
jgi:hypothetical protein